MGWVTQCNDCLDMHLFFSQLRGAVDKDVSEANDLLSERRKRDLATYEIVPCGDSLEDKFMVIGYPIHADTNSDAYKFTFSRIKKDGVDVIYIERDGPDTLPDVSNMMVEQLWSRKFGKRVMRLDGESVTSEADISRRALEPMFFVAHYDDEDD